MRKKRDTQGWLDFQPSTLKLTNQYFARYEGISEILDETPKLLQLVHRDLEAALELENGGAKRRGEFVYTSEMVLRLCLCQVIEGLGGHLKSGQSWPGQIRPVERMLETVMV